MNQKIAIVGMAGRFPDAPDMDTLFRNLSDARCSIGPITPQRIKDTTLPDWREYQVRGFMDGLQYFDHKLFNIPLGEAVNMDPHQRMLLEVAFESVENAGYNPDDLSGSNTAVFVADKNLNYYEHADAYDPTLVTGNASEFMAARLNRCFNLTGSTAMIDTSCSSSLVALHNACNELAVGDADQALVCAANLELFPYKDIGYHIEVDSVDGKSIPFSDQSNGMVYGEAVIALLLKPLDKAVADGNIIHAVISASSVNNNAARAASLTAPDSQGQAEVILRTWKKAGIDPNTIGFIEAHGSGTQLGDSLEVAGLTLAFKEYGRASGSCPMSTVKANIGHCRAAAGLAGLVKAVLAVKQGVIFPAVYTGRPSPVINFSQAPVYINEQLLEWKGEEKRRAGVSSIGFSGTNCHILLEEAPPLPVSNSGQRTELFVVSSWFREGLYGYVEILADYISSHPHIPLSHIAYTLSKGRKVCAFRKAFVARTADELLVQLNAFLQERPAVEAISKKAVKPILLFSDGVHITETHIEQWCAAYPVFAETFDHCYREAAAHAGIKAPLLRAFAFQVALHKMLESAGLENGQLMGVGIGRIITRVISKTQSWAEGLEALAAYSPEAATDPRAKMDAFLDKTTGKPLFIDLSMGSSLSQCLEAHPGKDQRFTVFVPAAGDASNWMSMLGALLFENNAAASTAFYAPVNGRRTELPAHPFQRTVCWIRSEAKPRPADETKGIAATPTNREESDWVKRLVFECWQEVLELETLNGSEHFFEAGGDSITASKMIKKLRTSLSVPLDFEDVFDFPVLDDFIAFIRNQLSVEQQLMLIWKEVLRSEELDRNDNFFELGGHSLLANQILNRIRERMQLQLDFEDFFLHPTIAQMGALVTSRRQAPAAKHEVIPTVPAQEDYAVSHAQKRLWVLSQMDKVSLAYNEFNMVRLDGSVNVEALQKAFQDIVVRHESFRTSFVNRNGELRQVIHDPQPDFYLRFEDIRGSEDADDEALRQATRLHLEPFDLANGPLFRAALLQLEDRSFAFLFAIHHIIFDEWSFGVFQQELSTSYNAYCRHQPLQRAPLSIQYKDYADWMNARIAENSTGSLEDYWLKQLSGEIPVLELPLDFPRPPVKTYDGKLVKITLPSSAKKFVDACGREASASTFMVLLASIKVLLYKYSGQSTLITGTPVAGRDHGGLEDQVGFYVNTLALKAVIQPRENFNSLLAQVKQTVIDGFQHQLYPFDLLVDKLQLANDRSRLPLFDTMVLYRKTTSEVVDTIALNDISVSTFADTTKISKFDIAFEFMEYGDEIVLGITYNTDLFLDASVRTLADRYLVLLDNLAKNGGQSIAQLSLVSEEESARLQNELGRGAAPMAGPSHLVALFEEQVQRNGKALAIRTAKEQLNYTELADKVNRLAAYLLRRGHADEGETVGLLMRPSIDTIVAILAVLKTGAAYVPIAATEPEARIRHITQTSGLRCIITDAKDTSNLPDGISTVSVSAAAQEPLLLADEDNYDPQAIACILYTSGSTGQPKGVRLMHQGLANVALLQREKFGAQPGAVLLQRFSYIFDFSVFEIFGALCNGASLYVLGEGEASFASINQVIKRYQITGACFTPTELKGFLDQVASVDLRLPATLKWIVSGGEALKPSLVEQHYALTHAPLINIYGPTETSVLVSYYETRPGDRHIPVGRPIPGVHLLILDEAGRPVPVGLPGRLYVQGIGVARDYVPSAEEQSRRFMTITDEQGRSVRRYDTGDSCRWLPDGNIEFMARADNQIKINGFRIEPGEVEKALLTHPLVADAVLVHRRNTDSADALVAYILPATNKANTEIATNEEYGTPAGEADLEQLRQWNDTDLPFSNELVYQLLERFAVERPDATAVRSRTQSLSYGELNEKVNKLAHRLLKQGLTKGCIVPVFCRRSPELLIALLALLKTGGVYMPIAIDAPAERISGMIEDAGAYLLLVENRNAAAIMLKDSGAEGATTAGLLEIVSEEEAPVSNPDIAIEGADLAYIIYTSGSTGKPKGAMIEHRGMMNHLYAKQSLLRIDEHTIMIQNAPQAFDISIWQLLGAMVGGGCTIVYEDETVRNLNEFARRLIQDQPTILEVVPSYLGELLRLPEELLASLRLSYLVVTGETFKYGLAEKWFSRFPQIPLFNAYGPTEAADDITHFIMRSPDDLSVNMPVGYPIPNMKIYVLNDEGQPCAIGVKGEIYTSGVGVGRGYVNNEEKTRAQFSMDPWHPGRRLYRTGDIGRFRADGALEFFGRKDAQVKIHGYRIELGEIERCLQQQPGITDAVVLCLRDERESPVLAAYITGTVTQAATVRNLAALSLPPYMVPQHIFFLDQFPLTPNGKINKRALPLPEQLRDAGPLEADLKIHLSRLVPEYMIPGRIISLDAFPLTATGKTDRRKLAQRELPSATADDFAAPVTPIQKKLCAIWESILEKSPIGLHDNFFDRGGNSLKGMRLLAEMERELGIRIDFWEIFIYVTVAQQAELFVKEAIKQAPAITRQTGRTHYPASHAQKRLWVLAQLSSTGSAYHISGGIKLEGALNKGAWKKAWGDLFARHEILRTTFSLNGQELVQEVQGADTFAVPFEWHLAAPGADGQALVSSIYEAQQNTTFDFYHGPLVRATLVQLSETSFVFIYTVHHILVDEWSFGILSRELLALYQEAAQGIASGLEPLPVHYRDYAVWHAESLENATDSRDYWRQQLEGELPVLDLPYDFPRPLTKTYNGALEQKKMEGALPNLRRLAQAEGTTMFMNLLAAVNVLLHRYSAQEDIIVGYPAIGRDHEALAGQVGLYQNTLALRTKVCSGHSFAQLVGRVKEAVVQAFAHQDYPFDRVLEDIDVPRDLSRSPLFDVMMIMHDGDMWVPGNDSAGGLSISQYSQPVQGSKFDLSFHFVERGDDLLTSINYNTDLFRPEHIRLMLQHLQELLASLAAKPHQPISRADLLSADERYALLHDLRFPADTQPAITITEAFASVVSCAPDELAVMAGGKGIVRRTLDEESSQLAHLLRNQYDIENGSVVAVRMQPSVEMVIAIMGILKTGAAYLPLDAIFPDEKTRYMLKDSGAVLTLTDEPQFEEGTVLVWDEKLEELLENERVEFEGDVNPNDIAYVIYTSGSTGRPKGVPITHGALTSYVYGFADAHLGGEAHRGLLVSSIAFDLGYTCFWTMLLGGGSLHLWQANDGFWDPASVWQQMVKEKISFVKLTPSHLKLLTPEMKEEGSGYAPKLLVTGGEKADPVLIGQWLEAAPGLRFVNHYGPTETTIGVLTQAISINAQKEGECSLAEFKQQPVLGQPLGRHYVRVLDQNDQLQGMGMAGEICIGGPGLTPGYLNLNKLTKEKIIADPYHPARKLYKSGDKGRRLHNGRIEFLGRLDNQVKVAGYRVETGEIEAAIRLYEGVHEATVVLRTIEGVGQLAAYIVADNEIDSRELRTHLRQHLADYMIPAFTVQLDSLPLTPNGKIDYRQLPEPIAVMATDGRKPSTPEQKILASAWQSVLGIEAVQLEDDFFRLGGDSIRAIQIVSQLHRQQYQLQVKDIFNYPVFEDLCRHLKPLHAQASQQSVSDSLPLSPIQQEFFSRGMLHPGHYNQTMLVQSKERMQVAALKAALAKVQQHHDALRLIFPEGGRQHNQDESFISPLIVEDRITTEDAFLEVAQELHRSFHLDKGPLFKAVLFRMPEEDRLVLIAHHLLVDGISWRIIMEDLSELYEQGLNAKPLTLPLKTDSFKTWVETLNDYILSPAFLDDHGYWLDVKAKKQTGFTISAKSGATGNGYAKMVLGAEETNALLTRAHEAYGTEINDLLLAAVSEAVHQTYGMDEAWIMLEGHGREEIMPGVNIHRTVGWFTAVYPVLIKWDNAEDTGLHIKMVKEALHRIPFKGIGYSLLRYRQQRRGEEVTDIRPQIIFNYLGQFDAAKEDGRFQFSIGPGDQHDPAEAMRYPLSISGLVALENLSLEIEYDRAIFDEAVIKNFTANLLSSIQSIVAFCLSRAGTELTPVDLGYSNLTLEQLETIFDEEAD